MPPDMYNSASIYNSVSDKINNHLSFIVRDNFTISKNSGMPFPDTPPSLEAV